jgi:hypothetical protein
MAQSIEIVNQTHPEMVELHALSHQAFRILQFTFVVAPLVAGVDKFFHLLTNWDQYLSPLVPQLTHLSAHPFMLAVGVVEIVAAVVVAVKPRIGSAIVAAWLGAIIINLLTIPGFFDVALRDLGLCLAAIALFKLSTAFEGS